MTPRDIVKGVFNYTITDTVPYHVPIYDEVLDALDKRLGGPAWRKRIVPYILGDFPVGEGRHTEVENHLDRSPYGYVIRSGAVTHLERPALEKPSLDGYKWPDVETLGDWDNLAARYRQHPGYRICGFCYGFFERASFIRGVESLLMDMIEHPQFVHDLMDQYLKLRLQGLDRIMDRIETEAIFEGGDDCDQRGPIMGLPLWREFIRPRLQASISHIHSRGFPVIAHMCGNVAPLIDDLLEMGLDGLESLQPEAMDVYALKKKVHGRMWLIGGLGTQRMLPFGTPAEVRAETGRLLTCLGQGGGYVFGPAKSVMADVPIANAVALLETLGILPT